MNRLQRIERFLTDYKLLNPYLKYLCKEVDEYYQNQLIREYVLLGRHPYPQEYLKLDK